MKSFFRRVSIYAYREIINRLLAEKLFPASLAKGGGTAKAVTEGLEKRGKAIVLKKRGGFVFESPLSLRDVPPLQGGREERCLFFNGTDKSVPYGNTKTAHPFGCAVKLVY